MFILVNYSHGSSLKDKFYIFFRPFLLETWIFILFLVVPAMALLFLIFDDGQSPIYPPEEPMLVQSVPSEHEEMHVDDNNEWHVEVQPTTWSSRFANGLAIAYLTLFLRSYSVPTVTLPAKINLYAMTFFLFGFGLTYTANLAAQLTERVLVTPISSFDEAVDVGYRICATRKKYEVIKSFHSSLDDEVFVFDDDGKPGFENNNNEVGARVRVLQQVDPQRAASDTSFYHAAVAPIEDHEYFQSKGLFCDFMSVGPMVAAESIGIPVTRHSNPTSIGGEKTSQLFTLLAALQSRGDFIKKTASLRPELRCSVRTGKQDSGLSIAELGGIWGVSFGFSCIAIMVYLVEKVCKKKTKNALTTVQKRAFHRDQHGRRTDSPKTMMVQWVRWNTSVQGGDITNPKRMIHGLRNGE